MPERPVVYLVVPAQEALEAAFSQAVPNVTVRPEKPAVAAEH